MQSDRIIVARIQGRSYYPKGDQIMGAWGELGKALLEGFGQVAEGMKPANHYQLGYNHALNGEGRKQYIIFPPTDRSQMQVQMYAINVQCRDAYNEGYNDGLIERPRVLAQREQKQIADRQRGAAQELVSKVSEAVRELKKLEPIDALNTMIDLLPALDGAVQEVFELTIRNEEQILALWELAKSSHQKAAQLLQYPTNEAIEILFAVSQQMPEVQQVGLALSLKRISQNNIKAEALLSRIQNALGN